MKSTEELEKLISETIPGATVKIEEIQGKADHLKIKVTSKSFIGKSLLEQHQAVQAALADEYKNGLHAVSIKTKTGEE